LRIYTEHHFGGRLGRQPEYDECEEGQQDAGQDEDVVVEGGDTSQRDGERQVRVWLGTARVVLDVLLCRLTHDLPLVARRVVTHVHLKRTRHSYPV